jgi:hypothetical protein
MGPEVNDHISLQWPSYKQSHLDSKLLLLDHHHINIDGCGDGKTNVDATTAEGSDDLEEELQYVKSADEMFIGSEGQGDAS